MTVFRRIAENPFLLPNEKNPWEAYAAFNPSVAKVKEKYHLLYRAMSNTQHHEGVDMSLSTIGHAVAVDGIHFNDHVQLIKPEYDWEKFGCEDPRVTFLNDKFYITYTALSGYPFSADNIRIAVAVTKDFKKIEKYPVTNFNSKAMGFFPDKINGKMAAILTVHTDMPPAKIALALFDDERQIWSEQYWKEWYAALDTHVIPLLRNAHDHLEVGACPIKTEQGWLVIYSYIQNYLSADKDFGIEAVLLDLEDPSKIIGKSVRPLLTPDMDYELNGNIPNIVFPSGALLEDKTLSIYYGATDTSGCLAKGDADHLLDQLTYKERRVLISSPSLPDGFKRFAQNPIIQPRPEFPWEAQATFNPAAIYEAGKVHILYRALSLDDTSVFGYANSTDGLNIDERLVYPIYEPRESFEKKYHPGLSGCEDCRLTRMGDRIYMFYTAYDGFSPRVALTSITVDNFVNKRWDWEPAKVITPPGIPDKNACLLPKKINDQFVIFHRLGNRIHVNRVDDLSFENDQWLSEEHSVIVKPRQEKSHIRKVGISSPPMETKYGWLSLYHFVYEPGGIYKVGAMMLALDDPTQIISHNENVLLEPEMDYEKYGVVPNVVFPCGSLIIQDEVFVYYGGADKVVGVAKMSLPELLSNLVM